jgi:hypothetical protein
VQRGRNIADAQVAESLYQRAIGYERTVEHKVQWDGQERTIAERVCYPPETPACKHWLGNRRPQNWGGRVRPAQENIRESDYDRFALRIALAANDNESDVECTAGECNSARPGSGVAPVRREPAVRWLRWRRRNGLARAESAGPVREGVAVRVNGAYRLRPRKGLSIGAQPALPGGISAIDLVLCTLASCATSICRVAPFFSVRSIDGQPQVHP